MPADWTRVKTLFDAALNEPVSGRSAWLRRACGADDEVRREVEELLALAEEIAEHFRAKRLDSFPGALCVKTEFRPIYAPEHIEQLRTFTSVLTLTFRVIE